jgi:hypothetical protein
MYTSTVPGKTWTTWIYLHFCADRRIETDVRFLAVKEHLKYESYATIVAIDGLNALRSFLSCC